MPGPVLRGRSSRLSDASAHHAPPRTNEESIKETLESIVIAFILAFVFRAYVVEAFVIPTGSMAPTLLGQHLRITCGQCGYGFTTDGSEPARMVVCPMCHYPNHLPRGASSSGDRILVHKYIYSFSEPRRWDVVVFKAPHDPKTNFIKRLVGLPNESVAIVEGNVYTRRNRDSGDGEPPSPWLIARKPDAPHGERVQRAVWQPIHHSPYVPLDGGDPDSLARAGLHRWAMPWVPVEPARWRLLDHGGFAFDGSDTGTIQFDFNRALDGGIGLYAYNQAKGPLDEPIEDIRLAVFVEPSRAGATLTLSTTARLDNSLGPMPLEARLDHDGAAVLATIDPQTGQPRILASADPSRRRALRPGVTRGLELWYVDQQASFWVDGRQVIKWQYDLPNSETLWTSPIFTRPAISDRPDVAVRVAGAPLVVHRLELDRDLYYGSTPAMGSNPVRAGVLKNLAPGSRGQPIALADDEFFVLGDNSPQSSDSRFWDAPDPWIVERMFHPNHPAPEGIVPRRLMIGRAFFVYFPGPFGWGPGTWQLIPNFGQMRFIH